MKKKGFTLIELLAVIVILAIIALIATPIILGVIEDARIGAVKSSAIGYIKAVEKEVITREGQGISMPTGEIDITTTEYYKDIQVQGEKPSKGYLLVEESYKIPNATLCINKYKVNVVNNKATVDGKDCDSITGVETGGSGQGSKKFLDSVLAAFPQLELNTAKTGCKTPGENNYTYMNGCYLKGNTTVENYVWYNGFLWRVMGINPDLSIKLITEDTVGITAYSEHGISDQFSESNISNWINNYFKMNFDTKDVVDGTWCYPTPTTSGAADTTCVGTQFTSKVGLLTLAEFILSKTDDSYLTSYHYYWSINPYHATEAWYIGRSGYGMSNPARYANGIRPVINVSSNLMVTEGDYKITSHAILDQKSSDVATGKLTDVAKIGQYVTLNSKNYRVVSKDAQGVKLILDGFEGTANYTNLFGVVTPDSYASNLVGSANLSKLVKTTWYKGSNFGEGSLYHNILNDTTNPYTSYAGIIRFGEMLSGQSASLMTKGYTEPSSYAFLKNYWTANTYDASNAWVIGNSSSGDHLPMTYEYSIRPVIKIAESVVVTGGNGMLNSPYKI